MTIERVMARKSRQEMIEALELDADWQQNHVACIVSEIGDLINAIEDSR